MDYVDMDYTICMTINPSINAAQDDNARKFITPVLDQQFLTDNSAVSYMLIVDYIETVEDSERKIVYRQYDSGVTKILSITKVTKDGSRTAEKKSITKAEYDKLLPSSVLHIEKKRNEFAITQNGVEYEAKYDEFSNSSLRMIEVDAASEELRAIFDPTVFHYDLREVTGDVRYYGYHVAEML